MTSQNSSIIITKEDEGLRLDHILTNKLDKTRSYIHYLFKEKLITCNSKVLKKSNMVKDGDLINVIFKELPEVKLKKENIPLDILFEDKYLIICNKPAGMVTHPAIGSLRNTFAGALLYYLKTLPQSDDPLRPGIVHRLDKETSGVIIGAKTTAALTALQKMFAERKVKKTYAAICLGYIKDQSVNGPIGRHPKDRKAMAVIETGKEALTDFILHKKHKGYSFIEAKPHTGRTHQIRVHAKSVGCPIVGDPLYGPKTKKAERLFLHAEKLEFIHPFTNKEISITAPLPNDMKNFWNLHKLT
ncbi:MAG: Ribosomal large subunit pseudouridine synthase D [Chlamydiia bacterium]|nr:Ribosomal large subunit pseudouridine synthase D [Chlamydiia bacterium]